MYKLVVINGPNRGHSFELREGEISIGRSNTNSVILPSGKVSKQHCGVMVQGDAVSVRDLGSSNGTFVNGALTKARKLKSGDRISVGDFVLELVEQKAPGALTGVSGKPGAPGLPGAMVQAANQPPADLVGKIRWNFENRLMPVFYGLNIKHQWRALCMGGFAIFVIGNLIISVYPLLESSKNTVMKETGRRARYMAREIADHNSQFLAARAETKTDIGMAENAEGVRLAVLIDLDNRIIAPGSKLNQYLASGEEASAAIKAKDAFRAGREIGFVQQTSSDTIVAIEPVKVVSPTQGKNVIVAMAVVSIDTSLATPDIGEMGLIYSETLILTGLLGGLILLVLYRLTLKPFEQLNEDMDRALKGELAQVTNDFKFEEMTALWAIINSAIQRVPKAGEDKGDGFGGSAVSIEEYVGPLKTLGTLGTFGLVVFDAERHIAHVNSAFEEISGIRSDSAMGQLMDHVARDQSMAAFCADMLGRVSAGGDGLTEDYDFSGITYKVHVVAFGSPATGSRCYVMTASKVEG